MTYLDPYRESARRYGMGFHVTLWASERSQRARFAAMARMCRLRGKRILDAGCSRGDLATYLLKRRIAFEHYIGVDALAEVIDHARTRNLPHCTFHAGDFVADPALFNLGDPQVIAMSGSLNTMRDEQIAATLDAAWRATREVLIFNFLSDRAGPTAPPQGPPVRRMNTFALLDWAVSRTPAVALRQDYFRSGHDATIMMRKR